MRKYAYNFIINDTFCYYAQNIQIIKVSCVSSNKTNFILNSVWIVKFKNWMSFKNINKMKLLLKELKKDKTYIFLYLLTNLILVHIFDQGSYILKNSWI